MTPASDPHGQVTVPRARMVGAINGVIEARQELSGSGKAPIIGATTAELLRGIARSIAAASAPDALPHP